MTPDDAIRALIARIDKTERLLPAGGTDPDRVLDALRREWQEAQSKATLAYERWHRSPGPRAYATYRAAQDRADAVQDALARRARDGF